MGVKDGFGGSTVALKVGLIILILSNICSWIAFCTTSWGYVDNAIDSYPGVGLWRSCRKNVDIACSPTDGQRSDWFVAFQAFGALGFSGLNISLILVLLATFLRYCQGDGEIKVAAIIFCLAGSLLWMISVIVFGVIWPREHDNDRFGFSFALAIIGLILGAFSSILLFVDRKSAVTSPA